MVVLLPPAVHADTKAGEKAVFEELKNAIPAENIRTTDDLYQAWRDVRDGKREALIVDIRTEAEFDNGHIMGSNNVDSGHAYTVPKKWPDENTEMWVFCRTQHRATYFTGMLYKYGYKNVYLVDKGIVGWIEKGYPLVNKYMGEIEVREYKKKLTEEYAYRENK